MSMLSRLLLGVLLAAMIVSGTYYGGRVYQNKIDAQLYNDYVPLQHSAETGAVLTLVLPRSGATSHSGGSALSVILTNHRGAPIPGSSIQLVITGSVPYTASGTTNADGMAAFPYHAGGAPYSVRVTASARGKEVAETSVQVAGTPTTGTANGGCSAVQPNAAPIGDVSVQILNPYSHAAIMQVTPGHIYLIRVNYRLTAGTQHMPITLHWWIMNPTQVVGHFLQTFCSSALLDTTHKDHAFVWSPAWPATQPYWAVGIVVAGHTVTRIQAPIDVLPLPLKEVNAQAIRGHSVRRTASSREN